MTYQDLIMILSDLSEERLKDDVTVVIDGEYVAVSMFVVDSPVDNDGVLDVGHGYLVVDS